MNVVGSVGARRIAILTTDDAILPEIQEWLASSFHTTLLNSWTNSSPFWRLWRLPRWSPTSRPQPGRAKTV